MNPLEAASPASAVFSAEASPDALPAGTAPLGSAHDPFSRALRVAGAVLLTISASTFMFKHWSAQNDIVRYWMLIGHTGVLVGAALFCSLRLTAPRSARVLFALVLASLPVHFTVLGSLLYSQFGGARVHLPSAAVWTAPSLAVAIGTIAGAVLLLTPATGIALNVLVRAHARRLGAVLGLSSALLLVPTRSPGAIGALLAAATLALLAIDWRSSLAHELRTPEGRAVRCLTFVPLVIIAGRSLLFYPVTSLLVAGVLAAVGWAWFAGCGREGGRLAAAQLQRWAVVPITIAAILLARGVAVDGVRTLAFCLLVTGALVAMGRRALGGLDFYAVIAGCASCLAVTVDALGSDTHATALIAIAVGAGFMLAAAFVQRLSLMLAAAATLVTALLFELHRVVDFTLLEHWGSLAAAGLLLVLGAAMLEQHGRRIAQHVHEMREHVSTWAW